MKHARIVLVVLMILAALPGCGCSEKTKDRPGFDGAVRTEKHEVGLLEIGSEALLARIHLIRGAKRTIELQTFIWSNDDVGRWVMYEMIEAARRGVEVRLIADQMFSETDVNIVAFCAAAHPNLHVRHYNPNAQRINPSRLEGLTEAALRFKGVNQRMHNKLLVVDGTVAVLGGRNIENDYFGYASGKNFRDREVIVRGPVVKECVALFERFWDHPLSVKSGDLVDVGKVLTENSFKRYDTRKAFAIDTIYDRFDPELRDAKRMKALLGRNAHTVRKLAFIADDPGKNESTGLGGSGRLTDRLASLALGAEKTLLIQSPYLVLSERGEEVFRALDEKGVVVSISSNSLQAADHWYTYGRYFQQQRLFLHDLGLRLYEFRALPECMDALWPIRDETLKRVAPPGTPADSSDLEKVPYFCIHAKSAVIDDKVAIISSYNLDPRSANLNTEVGLVVWDDGLATALRDQIERDIAPANSWVVARRQRPAIIGWLTDTADGLSEKAAEYTQMDLWPVRYASRYALKQGGKVVPPGDPAFYDNYDDVGTFPGLAFGDEKRIYVRLFKAFGKPVTPLL